MKKISIAGATGYTGIELLRLLVKHPEVETATLTAESHAGKNIADIAPSLRGWVDQTLVKLSPEVAQGCDVLFLALPHTTSMQHVPELLKSDCKIIDLSADYRLHDAQVYGDWYKTPHLNPELLSQAVYGLPELHRDKIKQAQLVANPGCYPTSAVLALAPLMKENWVDAQSIIIDSKSGVSGAGRKLKQTTQFCEANESVSAYGLGEHRHTPEIEQALAGAATGPCTVSFTPLLAPMPRGILASCTARLLPGTAPGAVTDALARAYAGEPFVRVLPPGQWPVTGATAGSNAVHLQAAADTRTGRVIVMSALDNLGKGAAGQAVQAANVMLGLPETAGLTTSGVAP